MVYRVRLTNDTRQVSVHLARIQPYHQRETLPAPQLEKLAEFLLGKPSALPELDPPDAVQLKRAYYIVVSVNQSVSQAEQASITSSTA